MRTLFGWALCLGLACVSHPGLAQNYPTKPIKLIVPFPAGGPNDIIARVVGARMAELLGQPVVVENRSGAGGVTGTDAVAKAEPDGHTIAITSAGALAISASLGEKLPYDATKDLQPVTLVARVPELLVVATDVPAASVSELVALAKGRPGKLNFASSGPGSMPHLAGELFRMAAGIDIVHVPYRGAAPAVNDLLARQVQMVFLDLPVLLPQVQAGKLNPLALAGRARAPTIPDVPTMAEAGLPSVEAENWYGLVVPPKTPAPIVAKLHAAAVDAMRTPAVQDKLRDQGAVLVGNTPEEFAGYIRSETEKWRKVVEAAGVKVAAPN